MKTSHLFFANQAQFPDGTPDFLWNLIAIDLSEKKSTFLK
jgi:hypothetical protein